MSYVYSINSIGLNIVYFASKRAALNYAVKHSIQCADGKIRLVRCRSDIAQSVRDDFNQIKRMTNETYDEIARVTNAAWEEQEDDE